MIQIAVLGYGTVGSGVVESSTRTMTASTREQRTINIKYVLDLGDFRESSGKSAGT